MSFYVYYPPNNIVTATVVGPITVNQGTTPWIISGNVNASQAGSWDVSVNNFPGSFAVTQGTVPWVVSGTVTANIGTTGGLALDSTVAGLLTNTELRATPVPISGTVTANQGTNPWIVSGTVAATQSGAWTTGRTWTLSNITDSINVGNFPATQPISGTVTANQGTSPWIVSGSTTIAGDIGYIYSALGSITVTPSSTVFDFTLPSDIVTVLVVQTVGTWDGFVDYLVSVDGVTWLFPSAVDEAETNSPTDAISSRINVTGFTHFRVSVTVPGTTGSSTFILRTSAGDPGLARIVDVIDVAQSGVWTTGRTWTLSSGTDSVNIGNFPATVAVTQSTSPWVISGSVTQGTSPWVTSNNNGAGGSAVNIQDGGNSITVDNAGTFAVQATLSAETTKIIGTVNIASGQTIGLSAGAAVIGHVINDASSAVIGHVIVDSAPSTAVTNTGTFAVQATIGAGSAVIGHVITDSGSTTVVTGNVATTIADAADVTFGAKADAKSTATDTTPISAMSVLKQISASVQAPPSQAVTNAGTFAVQATLAAETTKVIGTVNQGTSPWVANATLTAETTKAIGVVRNADGSGNLLTSTSFNSKQGLDVTPNQGFSTASNTRVAVDNSVSVQLLAANLNRKYAYIMNQTGHTFYLKLGAAAVGSQGIMLSNNGMYEITADNLWTGTVNAISSSSTSSSLDVFEGTP